MLKEQREQIARAVPMGRGGRVRDIADATVWLLAGSGDFVNGSVVVGEFLFFFGVSFGGSLVGVWRVWLICDL